MLIDLPKPRLLKPIDWALTVEERDARKNAGISLHNHFIYFTTLIFCGCLYKRKIFCISASNNTIKIYAKKTKIYQKNKPFLLRVIMLKCRSLFFIFLLLNFAHRRFQVFALVYLTFDLFHFGCQCIAHSDFYWDTITDCKAFLFFNILSVLLKNINCSILFSVVKNCITKVERKNEDTKKIELSEKTITPFTTAKT